MGEAWSRCYTVSWTPRAWRAARLDLEGALLDLVSSDDLRARGVQPEDYLYSVLGSAGEVYLCGRMRVGDILDTEQAITLLGVPPWDASEHALACCATPMRFGRRVPQGLARALRFETDQGLQRPESRRDGKLEHHAFRGVRRLTPESASLLDDLLREEDEYEFGQPGESA